MNKQEYLNYCYEQLLKIFQLAKSHQKDDKFKFRTEGFIHAGKTLRVISQEDAVKVMEQAHFEVFNESINSRKNRKANLKEAIERCDEAILIFQHMSVQKPDFI